MGQVRLAYIVSAKEGQMKRRRPATRTASIKALVSEEK